MLKTPAARFADLHSLSCLREEAERAYSLLRQLSADNGFSPYAEWAESTNRSWRRLANRGLVRLYEKCARWEMTAKGWNFMNAAEQNRQYEQHCEEMRRAS